MYVIIIIIRFLFIIIQLPIKLHSSQFLNWEWRKNLEFIQVVVFIFQSDTHMFINSEPYKMALPCIIKLNGWQYSSVTI